MKTKSLPIAFAFSSLKSLSLVAHLILLLGMASYGQESDPFKGYLNEFVGPDILADAQVETWTQVIEFRTGPKLVSLLQIVKLPLPVGDQVWYSAFRTTTDSNNNPLKERVWVREVNGTWRISSDQGISSRYYKRDERKEGKAKANDLKTLQSKFGDSFVDHLATIAFVPSNLKQTISFVNSPEAKKIRFSLAEDRYGGDYQYSKAVKVID